MAKSADATPVKAQSISGMMHGGQQPVTGATIQLYAVGTTGDGSAATPLLQSTVTTSDGSGTTNSNANTGNANNTLPAGSFTITNKYNCNLAPGGSGADVYLVGTGGNPGLVAGTNDTAIGLMAALGPCSNLSSSTYIFMDELTTVGSIAALAPYMSSYSSIGAGTADASALQAAFNTVNEYTNTATGNVPGSALPATYYASSIEIQTLGDAISACINSSGGIAGQNNGCGNLFTNTTPSGGSVPTNTIQATLNIIHNPTQAVCTIYNLVPSMPPYQPTLASCPSSWSLPIASVYLSIGGPSTLSIGQTAQFSATVSGTSDAGLTWQVNGVTGGSSIVGTISTTGFYTAPAVEPSPGIVTITALSQVSTASASSSLTLEPVSVSISGAGPIQIGTLDPFSATVTGSTNTAVTWEVNGIVGGSTAVGSVTTSGVYTPPNTVPSSGTVTITAISQALPAAFANATETILLPTPTLTSGTASESGTTVAVNVIGSNFYPGATIQVAGVSKTTTYLSATQLEATISVAPGTTSLVVDVINPNPGSSVSSTLNLTIKTVSAANYTVTAPRLTMHVGDPVPPCIILVTNTSTGAIVGEGGALFTGAASCTIAATSSSSIGSYPITVSAGTLAPLGYNTITIQNSSIQVIASGDGMGATINNSNPYPPGMTQASMFGLIDVTNNSICNMVGDNATDNTACLQELIADGGYRALAGAFVSTSGTTVTRISTSWNLSFSNLAAGTNVVINGAPYTIAYVISSTQISLTTSAGNQPSVLLTVPTTVQTNQTTVTSLGGLPFTSLTGGAVLINGVAYNISTINSPTSLTTTSTLPTIASAPMWASNWAAGADNRQFMNLYFPAGVYLVSAPLQVYGNYWMMMGDGPQTSVIRLAPNVPLFNGTSRKNFFTVASIGGNENFNEVFRNMGIDIGYGNPQATAIQWTSNNLGSMQNVQLWSEDSNAIAGVYLGETYTGPTMLKNIAVYGFQDGILANSPQFEYHVTADQITLEGQTTAGCQCSMDFSMQHLLSDNTVPAVAATTYGSSEDARVALLDSELFSNGSSGSGITVGSGLNQLYFNNVTCTGYSSCEIDQNSNWQGASAPVTYSTMPHENGSMPVVATVTLPTIFDSSSAPASLAIPDTETPLPNDPAPSTWVELNTSPSAANWCPSGTLTATSPTVYLPPGVYTLGGSTQASFTCTISPAINHIQMYGTMLSAKSQDFQITFNIADNSTTPLIIDACLYDNCKFNHTGTRTLVLRDTTGGYQAAPGAGNVYLEDVDFSTYSTLSPNNGPGPTFYAGQLITARQLDIETYQSGDTTGLINPKITCNGASLWMLGYKTEQNSPSLIGSSCRANIFGFFLYNLSAETQAQPNTSPFYLTNSSLFATGYIDWNGAYRGDQYWVQETRGSSTGADPMVGYNISSQSSGTQLPLFYSYGDGN